jgi:hypothetical protein
MIKKILKQLTPKRIKKETEAIQKIKLPPELQKWVREYEKVGERSKFLWKWLYKGDEVVIEVFNFPKKYYQITLEVGFLFNIFITLLDDISEEKREALLKELLKIPFERSIITFNPLNKKERRYLMFAIKVWLELEGKLKNYPYYKKLKNIFEYDVRQLLNTARYSFLVNKNPYLTNQLEYWMYLPHNMQVMIGFDVYLMCCFDTNFEKELGRYREIILWLQKMARIGNCLGTWEREVKENDFYSSGVLAYALEEGLVKVNKLEKNKLEIIKKIKNLNFEKRLFEEWDENYYKIKKARRRIKNRKINIVRLLSMIEKITFYHLAARGNL